MSKQRHFRYAWDTSVILGWLNRETSAPQADIEAVLAEIHANRATLIMSVVTHMEILETKHSQKQQEAWEGFLKRSSVLRVDVTFPIADKAKQIRERGLAVPKSRQRKIKVPDATVIATAIIQQADVLHSLDTDLINLSGSAVVDGLRITLPCLATGQMTFLQPPD